MAMQASIDNAAGRNQLALRRTGGRINGFGTADGAGANRFRIASGAALNIECRRYKLVSDNPGNWVITSWIERARIRGKNGISPGTRQCEFSLTERDWADGSIRGWIHAIK